MTDRDALIEAMARAMRADPDRCVYGSGGTGMPSVCYRWAWQDCIPQATAALSAIEAMGAVVVPVEATDAMLIAAHHEQDRCAIQNYGGHPTADDTYSAMLAASPYRRAEDGQ